MQPVADTIRLRAGEFINSLSRSDDEATLDIPNRGRLGVGDRVRVEISFGPMADEVDVFGEVERSDISRTGERNVSIRLNPESSSKLRYIQEVLGGGREAKARRHRRLPSSLAVRWDHGDAAKAAHLLDISAGGAFVVSDDPPAVGEHVFIQMRTRDILKPLRIESVVSWVRKASPEAHKGFGVAFKLPNAASASVLNQVVREHESAFAGHDWL